MPGISSIFLRRIQPVFFKCRQDRELMRFGGVLIRIKIESILGQEVGSMCVDPKDMEYVKKWQRIVANLAEDIFKEGLSVHQNFS